MASQPGTTPILVYLPKTYTQMLDHLRSRRIVALDTESDSLYRYYPKICLIQLSAGARDDNSDPAEMVDYLVDPLRLDNLDELRAVLARPGVEVVMHAAENDMLLLYRNFGFTFPQVFDTQLAARILGWKQVGLAAILETQFGIVSDKRMQRTNWGIRPLTPEQIAYAQMDTHYLPSLRQLLIAELQERRRWEEAQGAFAHLSRVDYSARAVEERTFWSMKSVRDVPLERLNVLEALWKWRENEARHQNRPPFKIMGDTALIEMAKQVPSDRGDLRHIPDLSPNQVDRFGPLLLRAVQEGLRHPQPQPPEYEARPELALDRAALARFDALRKWRSEMARQRDVAPDIVLPNSTLLTIAQRNPADVAALAAIVDIGDWKVQTYGPDILATLKGRTSHHGEH
jgi:ribonuclease D